MYQQLFEKITFFIYVLHKSYAQEEKFNLKLKKKEEKTCVKVYFCLELLIQNLFIFSDNRFLFYSHCVYFSDKKGIYVVFIKY